MRYKRATVGLRGNWEETRCARREKRVRYYYESSGYMMRIELERVVYEFVELSEFF